MAVLSVKNFFSSLTAGQKAIAAMAAFMVVMFFAAKVAFWALVFIFLASIAEIYNNEFRTPVHFDFVKLGTVMMAVSHGAAAGIFVGLASTFFSKLFSSRLDATVAISLAGVTAMAVLAGLFSSAPIAALGIALVAVYYLITTPINLIMGEEPGYALMYVLTSLAVNFLLFSQVAPRIMPLL
ncbi:hypothetical protein HYU17_05535 [Candidatus Woesearchaeota archaeon]|nr:hypothetical protein [Candidatus Woesearchaeota archaeon]